MANYDLVKRLRFGGNNKSEATRHEAADRIEALEAALRAVVVRCEEGDKKFDWIPTIASIARTALEPRD